MHKCLFFFLILVGNCFSYSSQVEQVISDVWEYYYEGQGEKCLEILTVVIDSPAIPNVDKVHYLIMRSHIHRTIENDADSEKDCAKAVELGKRFPECQEELNKYYRDYLFPFG